MEEKELLQPQATQCAPQQQPKLMDRIRSFPKDFADTGQLMISAKRWLTVSTEPVPDCDIVVMFPRDADKEFVAWCRHSLLNHVPDLTLRQVELQYSRCVALYVTASFRSLLKAADTVGLRKRLRSSYGGGYQEFTLEELDLFANGQSASDFFSSQERQGLVRHLLLSWRLEAANCWPGLSLTEQQPALPQLQVRGLVQAVFPLHCQRDLSRLQASWVGRLFRPQPLNAVQEYFGVKVALYFAWLGFYTMALLAPALVGAVAHFLSSSDAACGLLVCFNILWATVYLEMWKRHSSVLTYDWGTLDSGNTDLLDECRPLFKYKAQSELRTTPQGQPSISRITGRVTLAYPAWKRLAIRYLISLPVIAACLAAVVCLMLLQFAFQDWITEMVTEKALPSVVDFAPKVTNALVISMCDYFYKGIAKWLNDLATRSSPAHRQIIDNIKEVGIPFVMSRIRNYKMSLDYERQKKRDSAEPDTAPDTEGSPGITQTEVEASLEAYDDPYEDYLEMFIQYGYMCMFSCALPLAGVFCLINNVMEIRSDAFKLCTGFRRPFGTKVSDIGVWQMALEGISCVAVTVNVALLGVSGAVSRWFPSLSPAQVVLLLVLFEHIVLVLKYIIAKAIPDVPHWIEEEIAITEHKKRAALKLQNRAHLRAKRESGSCSEG
uniref:Anoctamin n=1 Tax=Macrostomum lignano TaxID=282301 RepID=A0A1I8JBS6_9PLAT